MKNLFTVLMIVAVLCAVLVPAVAADRGPQKQSTSVTTNAAVATVNLPIGDTGRVDPAWLVFSGVWGGTTQTISYVAQGATGTVGTVSANGILTLTNVPTLFSGDKFLMTSAGLTSNTVTVTVIGRVFD